MTKTHGSVQEPSRWAMFKKLVIFQIKLAMDAVRDLILSPVSFVCSAIDIIFKNNEKKSKFNQLMQLGSQTDIWLNMFNQHQTTYDDNVDLPTKNSANFTADKRNRVAFDKISRHLHTSNADKLIEKIEGVLQEQQITGGVTDGARKTIIQTINNIKNTQSGNNNN